MMHGHDVPRRIVPVLLLAGILSAFAPARCPADPGDVLKRIPSPCENPAGIAWGDGGIWIVDAATATLYRISPESGAVLHEEKLDSAGPAGIAWDGKALWISDDETKRISSLEPRGERGSQSRSIDAPVVKVHRDQNEDVSVRGLAWSGTHLWSGCIAGWSSRISKIDPETGTVEMFFFTRGIPSAVEAAEGVVWYATPTDGESPGVVFTYDPASGKLTGTFAAPGRSPSGLAFDGECLWYADADTDEILRLALE